MVPDIRLAKKINNTLMAISRTKSRLKRENVNERNFSD